MVEREILETQEGKEIGKISERMRGPLVRGETLRASKQKASRRWISPRQFCSFCFREMKVRK